MNIEFIITSGTVELLSNTNTGNNKLIVNGSEIPSTDWTGSGYYTTDGISIKKIADTSGNIYCNKVSDTEYELIKAVENPVYARNVIYDNTGTDLSSTTAQDVLTELDAPTFTEASSRANIESGEGIKTLWGKVKKFFSDLKTVAFTGSYTDLTDKPTIPTVNNATLTIQKNGTTVKTFTANASTDVTCNISDVASASTLSSLSSTVSTINTNLSSKMTTSPSGMKAKTFVYETTASYAASSHTNLGTPQTVFGVPSGVTVRGISILRISDSSNYDYGGTIIANQTSVRYTASRAMTKPTLIGIVFYN